MPYDESLFAGAASYYARYRAPYPPELIADIVSHFGLDGTGRLLDLGCGPGTLTLPLAPHFAEVVAIDADAGMIEEGRKSDATNVDWRVGRAEDVSSELGQFRLVTCGSSFHWMERDVVLAKLRDELLAPGVGVAMAGGPAGWLDGPEDWHQVVTAVVRRYLGERRWAGGKLFTDPGERFEQALERNRWRVELNRDYPRDIAWDIDGVIGHLWSTSFANQALFQERADEFERDLRTELLALRPENSFREVGLFGLVCGRPPL